MLCHARGMSSIRYTNRMQVRRCISRWKALFGGQCRLGTHWMLPSEVQAKTQLLPVLRL